MSCETRRNPDGAGYQLVITENDVARIEDHATLPRLLERVHALRLAWQVQGWRDVGRPAQTPIDA